MDTDDLMRVQFAVVQKNGLFYAQSIADNGEHVLTTGPFGSIQEAIGGAHAMRNKLLEIRNKVLN